MTEFDDVIRLLKERRPEATELELDEIKQRVRRRAARAPRRAQFMKSRLAILSMLVLGGLFSTTGAGLAVSGLATGNDAGVGQYGPPTPTPTPTPPPGATPTPTPGGNTVLPTPAPEGVQGEKQHKHPGSSSPSSNTPSSNSPSSSTPSAPVQPLRQVEAGSSSGQLPFTGFAAIPVLLGGIALLSAGLVLRRRSRDERA